MFTRKTVHFEQLNKNLPKASSRQNVIHRAKASYGISDWLDSL
jgi:hypothetical protein